MYDDSYSAVGQLACSVVNDRSKGVDHTEGYTFRGLWAYDMTIQVVNKDDVIELLRPRSENYLLIFF